MKKQYVSVAMILFFILTAPFAPHALGQTECWKNGTSILFTNGIWFDRKQDGNNAVKHFRDLNLDKQIDPSGDVSYDLAYNYSFGDKDPRDLVNAILQKFLEMGAAESISEAVTLFWSVFYFSDTLSPVVRDALIPVITSYFTFDVTEESLNEVVAQYRDSLSQMKKVLAVGHSQGGVFVNSAYISAAANRSPDELKYFSMFQVGTVASFLSAQGEHKNYAGDWVVYASKIFSSLPANIPIREDVTGDFWRHRLRDTYLNEAYPSIRNDVISGLLASAKKLHCKEPLDFGAFPMGRLPVSRLTKTKPVLVVNASDKDYIIDRDQSWIFFDGLASHCGANCIPAGRSFTLNVKVDPNGLAGDFDYTGKLLIRDKEPGGQGQVRETIDVKMNIFRSCAFASEQGRVLTGIVAPNTYVKPKTPTTFSVATVAPCGGNYKIIHSIWRIDLFPEGVNLVWDARPEYVSQFTYSFEAADRAYAAGVAFGYTVGDSSFWHDTGSGITIVVLPEELPVP